VPHFKLTLAYDGATLVGWQRQADGVSVQGLVEDALAELEGAAVSVAGAGRTDAGVHALGQVASVALARAIGAATLVRALNAHLPENVRVLAAAEVSPAFHARFSATAKTYQYRIWNGDVLNPFERGRVWHIPAPMLDRDAMSAAAVALEGRHDFAAFQAAGATPRTTERTIFSSRVLATDHGDRAPLLTYEIRGEGFLRHMVRTIVGTLIEIGTGRQTARWMRDVLESKARTLAGRTAPAEGLFLVGVEYDTPDL
jgi:tRNA pseudouridine38-40 synthase